MDSHKNSDLGPRRHVEAALRRLTEDGSPLRFRVDEDGCSVVVLCEYGRRRVTHAWPKWEIARYMEPNVNEWAEKGVRELYRKLREAESVA